MHDRGAIGLVRFFAAIAVAAPLAYLVGRVVTPILDMSADATAGTQAEQATSWFVTINDWLIIAFLGVAFFGLLALAVYQRGVGR